MAKKKPIIIEEPIIENISIEPLEEIMAGRYAVYAKQVIQDRAIPDVRDGLKPVQRRILFSMYMDGNTRNKPTRKCAHTVGAVMGKYHPHGDSSIYEALARMSQDWKVRYPLVDFQGNNGSIDGDAPAAYRYTESRLAELSNEMLKDIDKKTVDMQLTFDDTDFEPIVLPSRFPNLLCNGSNGIAVGVATEIPPHNLKEVVEAIVYCLTHKTATIEDLMEIVQGPDFPTGGIVYKGEGLKSIYLTGKGRIEIASRCQIIDSGNIKQIVITEIPFHLAKNVLVHQIDKIAHGKSIDGILEVRDESDAAGIRIVIDIKKNAPSELILSYLLNKTNLKMSYTANMVAIVNGRPKTLSLLDFIDSFIAHQVDVVTRRCTFDLKKYQARLHIVEGLLIASLNINDVVEIIRKSKDKADSKINLMAAYNFSNEQAEAIVMMPLYKLSHTDSQILIDEKTDLEKNISELNEILSDRNKLDRVIIKDLKDISKKYGDDRKTTFEDKIEDKPIDKRFLISKDKVYFSVTRDGYFKRSSVKSYTSTVEKMTYPEVKQGDVLIAIDSAWTTDFLICFTNMGNYLYVPVYKLEDTKWRDKGIHINSLITMNNSEKIISVIVASKLRDDLYVILLSKNGQIKRTPLSEFETSVRSRPTRCMRLSNGDELISAKISTGNANLMVFSDGGFFSMFNENELIPLSTKASGVKSMSLKGGQKAVGLIVSQENERSKIILITDKSCLRIFDTSKGILTPRLGKIQTAFRCFKSDIHKLVYVDKATISDEKMDIVIYNNAMEPIDYTIDDFHLTDIDRYAKKNIDAMLTKSRVKFVFTKGVELVDESIVSQPIVKKVDASSLLQEENDPNNEKEETSSNVEQISLLDDLD